MSGTVISPADKTYDEARKIWNGDVDRRPAVIARCASVEDVRAALAFGRSRGLQIAVKAGGHSLPGHSLADDALLIDLRPMNKVSIDATARRATVQGGAIWSEVDVPAQEHGLAVTGGHVTHTGVAGLTLGGGIGHIMRKFGLVVDNLLSAQIVTADGRVLKASEKENPDLFWAIRGGGGNFGIVTEFEFRLAPLGPTVLGGLAFWAPEKGPELMRRYREFCKTAPDEVTTLLVHLCAPPFDFVPKDVQHKPGYALVVAGTDVAVAERAVKEMRSFAPPLFDVIGPMPYLALQGMFDPALPHGTQTYLKGHYLQEMSDDAIRVIHERAAKMPAGRSQVFIAQMGGAVARVADEATSFGGRDAAFQTFAIGIWEDPADRTATVDWVRGYWDAMQPYAHGAYVNLSSEQDQASLRTTYGDAKFARLQRIKAKYDPENVFRLNQNIEPAKLG
ncbi:MAG: FAD-binding oxidoreductase [Candidatus Eisenbacteria bacterium]|nr:FAD-binding oxidoreductase [Candidatus Eisenbacteria bacterium]